MPVPVPMPLPLPLPLFFKRSFAALTKGAKTRRKLKLIDFRGHRQGILEEGPLEVAAGEGFFAFGHLLGSSGADNLTAEFSRFRP